MSGSEATGGRGPWTVETWEDSRGRSPFDMWVGKLDQYGQAVVLAVIEHILTPLGKDICDTEWGTPLGDGLYEVRIRRTLSAIRTWGRSDPDEADTSGERKVLLRLFVTFHGSKIVLLFHGYDKGKDSSERRQQQEIKQARKYMKAWRAEAHGGK